jgi:hypothetical protein
MVSFAKNFWKIRTNLKIESSQKKPNIIQDIKARRRKWLDHMVRMEDFRLPETILYSKLDKRRKMCRPKLRCFDDFQTNTKTFRIKTLNSRLGRMGQNDEED